MMHFTFWDGLKLMTDRTTDKEPGSCHTCCSAAKESNTMLMSSQSVSDYCVRIAFCGYET